MTAALWPLLGAAFLRRQTPQPSADTIARVRGHFVEHVRARGPLPTVRVGNQPYGVLPTTSANNWVAGPVADTPADLVDVVRVSYSVASERRAFAAQIRRGADMDTLLAQDAVSSNYVTRRFQGGQVNAAPTLLAPPRAQINSTVSESAPLQPNYVQLLRQRDLASITAERYPPEWPDARAAARPHALLYLLLRQAALQVLDPAAGTTQAERDEFLSALDILSARTGIELNALMSETLDACGFRIDAWVTSLATRRLNVLRQATEWWTSPIANSLIGAYGWLEDVRPRNPGGGAAARPSAGFVHAPSLAHAATTAVLRSGYVAHEQSGGSSSLAVDLSSERVRRAQWLLEGVRSGQPLGALLGYRFERALHQQRLDVYIAPFRTLAALKGQDELAQATQAAEDARVLDAATAATLDQRTAAATTARAAYDLATATFVATRTYRDGRAAELETIRALDSALATANQRVLDKTNEINTWQANRPTSVRLDTSDLDARGKPIPTVNLVDSAALTACVTNSRSCSSSARRWWPKPPRRRRTRTRKPACALIWSASSRH